MQNTKQEVSHNGVADHLFSNGCSDRPENPTYTKGSTWMENGLESPDENLTQEEINVMHDNWLPQES